MKIAYALIAALLLTSCKTTPTATPSPDAPAAVSQDAKTPMPDVSPTSTPVEYKRTPLSWESGHPEREPWTDELRLAIISNKETLLSATDLGKFCPGFATLPESKKIDVIAEVFIGTAFYESGWSPTSRMKESEKVFKPDPVTGQPVYSEGLLQLSYQDKQWAPWCQFDWNADKHLASTDARKTILDPIKNLECGVGIMARQVKLHRAFTMSSGVYWSTLKIGGTYGKISQIADRVRRSAACQQ